MHTEAPLHHLNQVAVRVVPTASGTPFSANRLLNRLPERELARVLPLFDRVNIAPRQVLHHRNLPMDHVYFVESGLISVLAKIDDVCCVEVWLIGSDGMSGVPIMLGDLKPPHRRVVQIGGTALRIAAPAFRDLLQRNEKLRDILLKYTHLVLLEASQSGACNAQHCVRERLARWLLLARDSLGAGRVPMPQQVLGRLIGVRRATISECLHEFECRGAVRTTRGLIEIADAELLESLACDCYRIIKRERVRLLG